MNLSNKLTDDTIDALISIYNIPYYMIMTLEEKKKIVEILTPLYHFEKSKRGIQKKKV